MTTTQKIQIVPGNSYNTLRPLGVRTLKNGLQMSERTNGDGTDVSTDEPLICIDKVGSGMWTFERENGEIVRGHINHFDVTTPYNRGKADASPAAATAQLPLATQIEMQRKIVATCMARFEKHQEALEELETQQIIEEEARATAQAKKAEASDGARIDSDEEQELARQEAADLMENAS